MEAAVAARRVLLADDSGELLRSLSRALEAAGLEADRAGDGQRAWERLRRGRYDLVVTDLRMPRMDGPELLRRIDEEGIPTRVMVITGHASLEAAVECLRRGAVDFLVKPFAVEAFLACVRRALERPLPRGGAAEPDWREVAEVLALTPRQLEVLVAFYRTGRGNRELAEQLCLSPHTVKSHLKVAFLRAGVGSRARLLQWLREFAA